MMERLNKVSEAYFLGVGVQDHAFGFLTNRVMVARPTHSFMTTVLGIISALFVDESGMPPGDDKIQVLLSENP